MNKTSKEHLEGLLTDVMAAQKLLDRVLSYNIADLWTSSCVITMFKWRKMKQAEQVLQSIGNKLAQLPLIFCLLLPAMMPKRVSFGTICSIIRWAGTPRRSRQP